jgi:hypothetical protein
MIHASSGDILNREMGWASRVLASDPPVSPERRLRVNAPRWLKVTGMLALAWAPFAVLWVLFVHIFVQATLAEAILSGTLAMGNAASLSVAVWWLSGRYPWPRKLRPSFYFTHVGLGLAYSVSWLLAGHLELMAFQGTNTLRFLIVSGQFGWRIIMGLWLYGLVAGVSYATRVGQRLLEQETIAARAEALAAKARLEGLRSQLNPHFLFNALHTARSLIQTDPDAAREAIERLGDLLRYSLDRSPRVLVPLADEWSFALAYLQLERTRLGDRLQVRSQLGSEAESLKVPPFLIQPLVENAVLHGIGPLPTGGTVELSATVRGENLVVSVRDDGMGAPREGSASGGHGHRLLVERLRAHYGDRASASFHGAPGRGFEAVVTLPAQSGRRTRR